MFVFCYRIEFGSLGTFWHNTDDESQNTTFNNLTPDLLQSGSFIYNDGHKIKTVYFVGDWAYTNVIAGSEAGYVNGKASLQARFNRVGGFVQVEKSVVLIADEQNHCIRLFNRTAGCVTDFVGKCTEYGWADGIGDGARFRNPNIIIQDGGSNSHYVYVSDQNNENLRKINMATKEVKAITSGYKIKSLVWDLTTPEEDAILIVDNLRVKRFAIARFDITNLFRPNDSPGHVDGRIDTRYNYRDKVAQFRKLGDLQLVHPDGVYLITDSNRLRLIDIVNSEVTTICTGQPIHQDGSLDECGVVAPTNFTLLADGLLLISSFNYIRILNCKFV